MPNNTQDGYANAFLGNFNNYSEGGRVVGDFWYSDVEAFVQDNWRVSRRVTLDLGIRFNHVLPTVNLNNNNAAWVRSSYNAAQAMRIYLSGLHGFHGRQGLPHGEPGSGRSENRSHHVLRARKAPSCRLRWAVIPRTPSATPGMEIADGNNPKLPLKMYTHAAIIPAVRFGVAWDVFGNGKTAIRTGFGQFANLTDSHFAQLPPAIRR